MHDQKKETQGPWPWLLHLLGHSFVCLRRFGGLERGVDVWKGSHAT